MAREDGKEILASGIRANTVIFIEIIGITLTSAMI